MSTTICSPTIALDPSNNWTAESLALTQDGNGTNCIGAGKLVLKTFDNRLFIPAFNEMIGFEVEVWGSCPDDLQIDSFTATAGTLLKNHDGELNCDWQKPFTGANPAYQIINAAGRTYYGFANEDGAASNGSEHFTNNYTVPTANYAVEARIYRASDGGTGERAEIYGRAALPYSFYYLSYLESTDSWELGVSSGGAFRTPIGTYSGDTIATGTSRLARLEMNGTQIKAYIDGVLRISGTSATYASAGFVGCRLDPGSARTASQAVVSALYDLGAATTVTRVRFRYGSNWGNSYGTVVEGSNDGTTWTNAYTGLPGLDPGGSGTFAWATEVDTTQITGTAYRYWRVTRVTDGISPDVRIGDFRLYTSSGIVVLGGSILTRGGLRGGSTPFNWSEGIATTNISDNSPGDNTSWIGGAATSDPANEGLQLESFDVKQILPDSIRIGLTKDGSTFAGTPKTLLLTSTNAHYTLGSPVDLWGTSWTVADIQSSQCGILIERTSASSAPIIDFSRAIIYHTGSGGTFTVGYRETTRQRIQYGWESTFGTAVAANKRLRSIGVVPQANPEFKTFRPAGEKLESEQMIMRESSSLALSGQPCYNEMGVLLSLMTAAPVSNGTLNMRQEHFFRFDNRGEQKGRSISLEYGEDPTTIDIFGTGAQTFNRGSKVKAFTLAEMGIELSRAESSLSGNAFAHKIALDQTMSAGSNDQQTFTITATGGSFKARWNGSAWATIALPLANAAALDTALELITTIGANGLTVTGAGPYVVEFSGTGLSGKVQPLIEIDGALATGGTVVVTHTQPGGVTEFPIVPIVPGHVNVYLADTYATLNSNRMQRCSVMNFSLQDRFSPFWTFNRANANFLDKAEGTGIGARFAIKAHADSEATSLLGTARSNVRKFIRVEAIGPLADGSLNYEFVMDAAVKVAAVGQMEDEDGMYMCNYELALTEDRTWGNSLIAWLRNMMTNANYT